MARAGWMRAEPLLELQLQLTKEIGIAITGVIEAGLLVGDSNGTLSSSIAQVWGHPTRHMEPAPTFNDFPFLSPLTSSLSL